MNTTAPTPATTPISVQLSAPEFETFAPLLTVYSASILAETLGDVASFSSPWRGKRHVVGRRKPLLTDQLQPSTNADKLSVPSNRAPSSSITPLVSF